MRYLRLSDGSGLRSWRYGLGTVYVAVLSTSTQTPLPKGSEMETTTSYELSQKFFFDAAHTLDRKVGGEGSRRIHGHTYYAQVAVRGTPHPDSAMLVDLGDLNEHIRVVRDQLDHRFLDEVPGLGAATLENLCAFIHRQLSSIVPNVVRVRVERPASGDSCELVVDVRVSAVPKP